MKQLQKHLRKQLLNILEKHFSVSFFLISSALTQHQHTLRISGLHTVCYIHLVYYTMLYITLCVTVLVWIWDTCDLGIQLKVKRFVFQDLPRAASPPSTVCVLWGNGSSAAPSKIEHFYHASWLRGVYFVASPVWTHYILKRFLDFSHLYVLFSECVSTPKALPDSSCQREGEAELGEAENRARHMSNMRRSWVNKV